MFGDDSLALPLGERSVSRFDPSVDDASAGRRLRVFGALVQPSYVPFGAGPEGMWWVRADTPAPTYGDLLQAVESDPAYVDQREAFAHLPFRIGNQSVVLEVPDDRKPASRDPDLHPALQDLGNEINEDLHEALDSLDDARAFYPGVDEGIEPVTDEHVKLVIWALQRELNRELRSPNGQPGMPTLPAAPLSELPWQVQRALAERRRWRYQQWGVGRSEWERNEWSLWNVPEDGDYVPRRAARLAPSRRVA
jgi:hypothetical protein